MIATQEENYVITATQEENYVITATQEENVIKERNHMLKHKSPLLERGRTFEPQILIL